MEVGMREFQRKPAFWLKQCPLELTMHGKVVYKIVSVEQVAKESNVSQPPKEIKNTQIAPPQARATYGCGCEREEGKMLCSKHCRI